MHYILSLLITVVVSTSAYAAEFAVVQDTARTTTGTKQYTSSGFGTPKGALLFVTNATVNGTAAAHALTGMGVMDGTNQVAVSSRSKDGIALGTTLAGTRGDPDDCLLLTDQDGTVILRAECTNVTDGIELNFLTAPASALLIKVVLFGGTGVTNVYAGKMVGDAVQNNTVDITAPNFEPTIVFAACLGDNQIDDAADAGNFTNFGIAINDGASPPTQYGMGVHEASAVATQAVRGSLETTTIARELNNTTGQELEVNTFDSQGFSITTRVAAGATECAYLAVRTTGLSYVMKQFDTPTSNGAFSITSIGSPTFTPQFGLLLGGSISSVDTRQNREQWGLGFITTGSQASIGLMSDDAQATTTDSESTAHDKPIFLRAPGSTYMEASFTSFGNGTATFDFTTQPGSVRKWVGLFVSDSARRRISPPIIFH